MQEFEFTLKFALTNPSIDPEEHIARLGEEGCDDAIIGVGQNGKIALQFNRGSESAFNAVISAIEDVKRAIPDAKLIEASPDLVGLSDIAELMGFTRQNIRKLMMINHTFPTPVHAGKSSIWHLANILHWLEIKQNRFISPSIKEMAMVNMQVNIAKENSQSNKDYQAKLMTLNL